MRIHEYLCVLRTMRIIITDRTKVITNSQTNWMFILLYINVFSEHFVTKAFHRSVVYTQCGFSHRRKTLVNVTVKLSTRLSFDLRILRILRRTKIPYQTNMETTQLKIQKKGKHFSDAFKQISAFQSIMQTCS